MVLTLLAMKNYDCTTRDYALSCNYGILLCFWGSYHSLWGCNIQRVRNFCGFHSVEIFIRFFCVYSDFIKGIFVIFIEVCDENVPYIFQRFTSLLLRINQDLLPVFLSRHICFPVSKAIYIYIYSSYSLQIK